MRRESISALSNEELIDNRKNIIDYFNKINFDDLEKANSILKLLIDKIVVFREKEAKRDSFEVEIYFNIL